MAKNSILEIQEAINDHTGYGLALTGKRDKPTINAIQNFQRLQNMKPTGIADEATLARLFPRNVPTKPIVVEEPPVSTTSISAEPIVTESIRAEDLQNGNPGMNPSEEIPMESAANT